MAWLEARILLQIQKAVKELQNFIKPRGYSPVTLVLKMTRQQGNRIKALFLLTVFSLNTVVGFACSVGVDMGFNSKHHHPNKDATEAVVHIHADGKKHIHHEKTNQSKNHHHSGEEKDNCCNDQVTKIAQVDKSVPQSLKVTHPNFLLAFVENNSTITLPALDVVKNIKQFVRSYHPPISDIRIAIQSFQI